MLLSASFLAAVLTCTAAVSAASDAGIYNITVKNIHGNDVSLDKYRGKILLIVNVASECGYTDTNYKELVLLQDDHESNNFAVLAFPCNQFGQQEPGSDVDIEKFAREKYNINFPLFSKVLVYGEDSSHLYEYLFETTGSKPSWNFAKYLVDRNGEIVQFFTEKEAFSVIRHSIEYLVNKHADL